MTYNPGYVDGSKVANNAAYAPGLGLFKVYDNMASGITYWIYVTSDALTTVLGTSYFSDATDKRMKLGDRVDVYNGTLTSQSVSSPAGVKLGAVTFPATVGLSSTFSSVTVTECVVTAVTAASGNTPGAATIQVLASAGNGLANFRNLLDGGDFTVNPWQRGTTFSNISGTIVYTADRWFVTGTDVTNGTQSCKAARAAFSSVAGFSQAFRFGRQTNASALSSIVAGQIMETADSIRTQGQQVTLSFWAAAEANFSPTSNNMLVQVVQGNGTDQSAASAVAGTWTGQTNVVSSLQAITSTMTRYQFTGTVSSATTQLGVLLSYVPVGSAGSADTVLLEGVQLEMGGGATNFEHRDVEVELALCQRYCFVLNEPASGIAIAPAVTAGSNRFAVTIPLPTPMRAAPSIVVSNGSFGFEFANAYLAGTGLAAGVGHTTIAVNVVMSATAASNNAASFVGGSAAAGFIIASAEY